MPTCMECGATDFSLKRRDAMFCCREHTRAYHNRQVKRGNKILPLVYRWRALRSSNPDASNAALSFMCALMADWIEDDRAKGRAIPLMPELSVATANAKAAVFKPTRSKGAASKATRKAARDFAIQQRNQGIKQ